MSYTRLLRGFLNHHAPPIAKRGVAYFHRLGRAGNALTLNRHQPSLPTKNIITNDGGTVSIYSTPRSRYPTQRIWSTRTTPVVFNPAGSGISRPLPLVRYRHDNRQPPHTIVFVGVSTNDGRRPTCSWPSCGSELDQIRSHRAGTSPLFAADSAAALRILLARLIRGIPLQQLRQRILLALLDPPPHPAHDGAARPLTLHFCPSLQSTFLIHQ